MQRITKNGVVKCETEVHYPPEIVAQLKKAGYKVKEISDGQKRKKDEPAPQGTD